MAASGHPAARGGTEIAARVDGGVASLLSHPDGRGRRDSISRSVCANQASACFDSSVADLLPDRQLAPIRIGPAF